MEHKIVSQNTVFTIISFCFVSRFAASHRECDCRKPFSCLKLWPYKATVENLYPKTGIKIFQSLCWSLSNLYFNNTTFKENNFVSRRKQLIHWARQKSIYESDTVLTLSSKATGTSGSGRPKLSPPAEVDQIHQPLTVISNMFDIWFIRLSVTSDKNTVKVPRTLGNLVDPTCHE